MVSTSACDAPALLLVLASISAVLPSAVATGIFSSQAFPSKVPPTSAFYALDGFEFLFCWSDSGTADNEAIPNDDVSKIHRVDG